MATIEQVSYLNAADYQLPMLDLVNAPPPPGEKRRMHKVQRTISQIRMLADELNQYLTTCPASERPLIHSPADASTLFMPVMTGLEQEELWILCLNQRNRVIALIHLYTGSVNCTQIRMADIFREAIRRSAISIVIAHNHPSGDPSPSTDDTTLTRSAVQAGKLLDIEVLDHLIIGNQGWVSLKERGLGFS